jgi:hypothetical protein
VLNASGARAWDSNRFIRDFDHFGYKFALLSSVGSAGLNSIVNTLPARDAEEFEKFPKEDLAFMAGWLAVSQRLILPFLPPSIVLSCSLALSRSDTVPFPFSSSYR